MIHLKNSDQRPYVISLHKIIRRITLYLIDDADRQKTAFYGDYVTTFVITLRGEDYFFKSCLTVRCCNQLLKFSRVNCAKKIQIFTYLLYYYGPWDIYGLYYKSFLDAITQGYERLQR